MKKYLLLSLTLIAMPLFVYAQKYEPLVTIPGVTDGGGDSFGSYINFLYAMSISIAALLAVIKIIIAGVKYMLTDVVPNKGEALSDIKGSLLGLLLILGAFLVLNTINPQLTKTKINFQTLPEKPKIIDRAPVTPSTGTTGTGTGGATTGTTTGTATGGSTTGGTGGGTGTGGGSTPTTGGTGGTTGGVTTPRAVVDCIVGAGSFSQGTVTYAKYNLSTCGTNLGAAVRFLREDTCKPQPVLNQGNNVYYCKVS